MDSNSMPTEESAGCCLADCGKPEWDERRGLHLLSPHDLVRFGSTFWEVTGVELHTTTECDVITIQRIGNLYPGEPECRVPLTMIERGTVYLRAEKKTGQQ